jgi:hypothetical protein
MSNKFEEDGEEEMILDEDYDDEDDENFYDVLEKKSQNSLQSLQNEIS